MAPTLGFDSLLNLASVPSKSSDFVFVFVTRTPREMGGGGNRDSALFGGYLLALATKAALTVANAKGYPHIMTLSLDILQPVSVDQELETTVQIIRSSRRICFLRATTTISNTPNPVLAFQSTCGYLSSTPPSPSISHRVSPRYSFSRTVRASAPSLISPSTAYGPIHTLAAAMVPSTEAPAAKVTGLLLTRSKNLHAALARYSEEALTYCKGVVARRGIAGLAKESWEGLDDMPCVVGALDAVLVVAVVASLLLHHRDRVLSVATTISGFGGDAFGK
ncbi:hypothetical protein HDU93_009167 [Gonapodya sp. JEL0774]|nr:hypothetical protein HDU93_009167 [Gonapodya sp. JEL0774]